MPWMVSLVLTCFLLKAITITSPRYGIRTSVFAIIVFISSAIFEAIFWKPAFEWKIKKIEVLNPIKWINLRRNEVGAVANDKSSGIIIEENRQQRAGLFLKDVRYRIYADLVFIPLTKRKDTPNHLPEYLVDSAEKSGLTELKLNDDHPNENPAKYNAMFKRRAKKGQCFFQPYFGCREFSAFFKLADPEKEPSMPIEETRDLGFMLYDMDYSNPADIHPAFFRAKLENGIINVPDWNSEEVRK